MCKRLLFLICFVLALGLAGGNAVLGTTLEIGITDELNDAEEDINPSKLGEIDSDSSDLEMPYEDTGMGDPQFIGLRYELAIGKGVTITDAWVQFQVDELKDGSLPVNLIIEGELTPDANAFSTDGPGLFDISSRPRTAAQVKWSVPNWENVGDRGPAQATPNLAPILQELIDQPGWAYGNAIVLIISDDPNNPSQGNRGAEAGPGDDSATLTVAFGGDPFLQDSGPDGIVSIEAENFHNNIAQGEHAFELVGPTEGFTGVAGMQGLPNQGTNANPLADWLDRTPRLDYDIALIKTGTYYVWVRAWGASGSDDSCHVGLDGQAIDTSDRMTGFNGNYRWSNDTMDSAPSTMDVKDGGVHVLNLYMREDGAIIDKIVLTTNPDYVPEGDGPPESGRGLPVQAFAPNPPDGAIELVDPMLEWTGADAAVSHQVYLSADETIDDADFIADTELTVQEIVTEPGVTYYWRVDEVTADGTVNEGMIWRFATLPLEAHFPSPADGATLQAINTQLAWTDGLGALVHNLFLSTDQALVEARDPSVQVGQWLSVPAFDPGLLENDTIYYWAVDEFLGTATNAGPVWSFTTIGGIPIADPDRVAWYTFDKLNEDDPDGLVIDWSGYGNTGTAKGDVANIMTVDDADMGKVLSLPGGSNNFVDCGDVGISGNDPTTIACWAKADNTSIPNWTLIFGFTGQADGSGGNGSHFNIGSLGGPGGVGAHVWGWEETIFSDEEALEWHHYAMTYDGTTIAYFGDGVPMDTDEGKSNVRDLSIRADRVHIGSRITQDSSFPGDVDDCAIYNRVLSEAEIVALMLRIEDVTGPNDVVQGVPNDGDWPGAETPDLAVDGDVTTKYLHFKGDELASGIQVAPAMGPTLVTGLTLTTANDVPGRDPVSFELCGSNESIDGPYELIASGDIVDFAQEAAWPRFTQNATAITFENDTVYAFYQLLFPAIRGPVGGSVNSMQIAEVELLGTTLPLISSVVRSNGTSGDRDRIGVFDGDSPPMPMVEGGLANAAPVFSDRTYTWGGVPDEYVGTEYIATFNTDKNGGTTDVTYEVTITQAAIVWITVDDRIPAEWDGGGTITSPQDAADSVTAAFADPGTFTDTGIDLLVVGDNDRPMSVFAAELPAGTYVFGSMDSGKNFYSIGAVPQ